MTKQTTEQGWVQKLQENWPLAGSTQITAGDWYRLEFFISETIAQEIQKHDEEKKKLLYALGLMWNQYCGKEGHKFMSAGEAASELLEKHGLLVDEWP